MRLTERIQVKRIPQLSQLCHLAKNLYNAANFQYRQFFFHLNEYLTYYDLQVMLKSSTVYKALPAQTSQQILHHVISNWKAYWKGLKSYCKDPQRFMGCPKPPKYKPKNGESVVFFTNQNAKIKNGFLYFPKSTMLNRIKTRIKKFQQVRIIPKGHYYIIEIIYERKINPIPLDSTRAIGIDIGVNNLIAIGTNCGVHPILIPGRVIKAINQQYNKLRAYYRSNSSSLLIETRKLNSITIKRYNKINDFFHKTSRFIVNFCILHKIGTIGIGYNKYWKQKVTMGKISNQNFVSIPFLQLINQIKYKAILCGISVKIADESFTSKCSALDLEPIGYHPHYLGKRVHRGLFQSNKGILVNADINGALNILRKVVPVASWGKGIEAVVLQPKTIQIY